MYDGLVIDYNFFLFFLFKIIINNNRHVDCKSICLNNRPIYLLHCNKYYNMVIDSKLCIHLFGFGHHYYNQFDLIVFDIFFSLLEIIKQKIETSENT